MSKWATVFSSMNENIEYPTGWPSVRKVKSDLGISGRKCKIITRAQHYTTYRLCGTVYEFTITYCE